MKPSVFIKYNERDENFSGRNLLCVWHDSRYGIKIFCPYGHQLGVAVKDGVAPGVTCDGVIRISNSNHNCLFKNRDVLLLDWKAKTLYT